MRATSRRRRPATGRKYLGAPGKPVAERERHDYTGDGPAFCCLRCRAVCSATHPKHAPGGKRAKPWDWCGMAEDVASDRVAMPLLTRDGARAERMVTNRQVAARYGMSVSSIRILFAEAGVLPQARLLLPIDTSQPSHSRGGNANNLLYLAMEVERAVAECRPRWRPVPRGQAS